jgi:threonyl-tRNA synthetase
MSNVEKMYGKNKNIPESLYKVRHSLAHVMAEAVLDFFPEAKPTIGPPIDTGLLRLRGREALHPEDLRRFRPG